MLLSEIGFVEEDGKLKIKDCRIPRYRQFIALIAETIDRRFE